MYIIEKTQANKTIIEIQNNTKSQNSICELNNAQLLTVDEVVEIAYAVKNIIIKVKK